ncbi:proton-conducting transporter membrane subunit [Candidatus Altiarchaeota archaeon]
MESQLIPILVVFPIIVSVILNLMHGKNHLRLLVLALGLVIIALPFTADYGLHTFGGHLRGVSARSLAPGIVYTFNSQKMLSILVLSLICYLAIIAYLGAFRQPSGVYLSFLIVGIASATAVILTDDIFNFYVFMEIALISQTALVIATGTIQSVKASVKYLIVGNVAMNLVLLAIGLILASVGSLNISDIQRYMTALGDGFLTQPTLLLAAGLLIFGWAYSSGLFPFHSIKSEMYGSAEPHAAGFIQTMTKFILVSYAIILLRIFSGVPTVRPLMLALSMGAMIFGVVMALRQDDYRRLLSFHAVSQAGYVAGGLSIGTPLGIAAGIFHAVNHVLYKSALFIGCEVIKYRSKTTDFHKLGGAIVGIPFVGALVLGAKFAISGIPPFNGFQSKLMLLKAAMGVGMPEIALVMILVSIATFASMMKAFYMVYLKAKEGEVVEEPVPATHVLALIILVGLCVLLGLYPDLALRYIMPVATNLGSPWPGGVP